jgi:prepilin-type N-terminal cleavage/methylation domain-containing protein
VNRHVHRSERGLSLLELLVVVLVVAIVTAIAVPAFIAATRAAREARAVANLKAIGVAQIAFYASAQRFATFERLFRSGALAAGQFGRGRRPGSATEAVSDGVYLYSFRFEKNAASVTIDADPEPSYRGRVRWFRYRVGRSVKTGSAGIVYAAPPSERPPASSDYALYRP